MRERRPREGRRLCHLAFPSPRPSLSFLSKEHLPGAGRVAGSAPSRLSALPPLFHNRGGLRHLRERRTTGRPRPLHGFTVAAFWQQRLQLCQVLARQCGSLPPPSDLTSEVSGSVSCATTPASPRLRHSPHISGQQEPMLLTWGQRSVVADCVHRAYLIYLWTEVSSIPGLLRIACALHVMAEVSSSLSLCQMPSRLASPSQVGILSSPTITRSMSAVRLRHWERGRDRTPPLLFQYIVLLLLWITYCACFINHTFSSVTFLREKRASRELPIIRGFGHPRGSWILTPMDKEDSLGQII